MSWNLHTAGTKEEVAAAIDEAITNGMPKTVGDYLKDTVSAVDLAERGEERYLVLVESLGHRPLSGSGAKETCTVTKIRRGPWR